MLNLMTKTKPWMLASLIAATSVFGKNVAQCPPPCPPEPCAKPCPQPCPPTQICPGDPCCPPWPTPVLNAAYNYPARIQTRCPWDFFFDVSFIYWQPIQDNLEFAFANTTGLVGGVAVNGLSGNFVNMHFKFKPGFKVGMGGYFDHDNWDWHLEYTWFHNTQSRSTNGPAFPGHVATTVGNPSQLSTNSFYDSASQSWRLRMDILDLDIGRWHYVGQKLIMHPTFGMRVDWLRQRLSTQYTRATAASSVSSAVADTANMNQKTSSWAIGPKIGLDTDWKVGSGFRFFGNAEADLLFTKYTRLSYNETHTVSPLTPFSTRQKRTYAIKPHVDLELGFAWSTFLDCNNWYMDFIFGYEFQVFWDQNMFRHFNSSNMPFNSFMPNGNLYVQGLNVTFKVDF